MSRIIGVLSLLVSIYMLVIFVRLILSWFSGMDQGGVPEILAKITDPYLNWFRRFTALRVGYIDLSPIVALSVLALLNRVLSTLAYYGTITLGIFLALILQAAWGAASFFLGFLIIVLILRLIAHLFRLGGNQFWFIIGSFSQPVLYRISRFFFRTRIVSLTTAILISLAILVGAYVGLYFGVILASGVLVRLPI